MTPRSHLGQRKAPDEAVAPVNDQRRFFSRLLFDASGVYLAIIGAWATWATLRNGLNIYDEGIILAHSNLILRGQAPYRDFYTNYPPGIFLIVAGLWKIFGISGATPRLLGIFLHLVVAFFAGRLAGRIAARSFSWFSCGCVLLWLSFIGAVPYAWLAATAMALLTVEIFLFVRRFQRPVWFFIWGLAFGAISGLRHDLFFYFFAALTLVLGLLMLQRSAVFDRAFRLRAGWGALGLFVSLFLIWAPVVACAGFEPIARDLYFDQVQYIRPARKLPLPSLFGLVSAGPLPFRLPASLAEMFPAAVVLSLSAPLGAGLMLVFAKLSLTRRLALSFVGGLALASLPQMLGRTDPEHAIFTVAPALIIAAGMAENFLSWSKRWWQQPLIVLGALLLLVFPARQMLRPVSALKDWWIPPLEGRFAGLNGADQERRETLEFIRENTQPGEGIFVGNSQHRQIICNDVSLYYLSNRPGVTRYLQFDPNIVTRLDVQRQIVSDLDSQKVKIAILLQGGYWEEPNESRRVGADFLDDYLAQHFENVGTANNYLWLRRKAGP